MALNPITYTENVIRDFLRYQLTAYPFADERLRVQMRDLLSLDRTRETPLLKGPYISLSRGHRTGATVESLVEEGVFHPHMKQLVGWDRLYGHQERAIRAIHAGRHALVSTGTGSGKTECFLYPVISHCLDLRDENAPDGIVAVFVYPMNALAEDQLLRMRHLLVGTGIPFGMYVGKTPDRSADVSGHRLRAGATRADYEALLERGRREQWERAIHPPEERASRQDLRDRPPRILLTNVKQLELLLTRARDVDLFAGADLRFLVFDEVHTFSGVNGAESACLVRRLRSFCGSRSKGTVCIGTSATLTDPDGDEEAPRRFASRFFGVPEPDVALVTEQFEETKWGAKVKDVPAPTGDPYEHLEQVLRAVEAEPAEAGRRVAQAYVRLGGAPLVTHRWQEALYEELSHNVLCKRMAELLDRPMALADLAEQLGKDMGRPVLEAEVLCWLTLGAAARREERPLLRPVVHVFVRGVSGAVVTFEEGEDEPRLWLAAEDREKDEGPVPLKVTTCSTCGQHYFVHFVADLEVGARGLGGGEALDGGSFWKAQGEADGGVRVVLVDRMVSSDDDDEAPPRSHEVWLCRFCGSLHDLERGRCAACGRSSPLVRLFAVIQDDRHPGQLTRCIACGGRGRSWGGSYREPARPVRAVTVSDVHVLAQNMLHYADRRRLLVFSDNRQDAAFQAGWMQDHARRFRLRSLMMERIERTPVSVGDLVTWLDGRLEDDDDLSRTLIPEVWRVARKEAAGVEHANERKRYLRLQVLRELATGIRQRLGLEPWGRLQVDYLGLGPDVPFVQEWAGRLDVDAQRLADGIAAMLDQHRRGMQLHDREEQVFSRFWREGDRDVQRGYIPPFRGVPQGVKLERDDADDPKRVQQWLSGVRPTRARQAAAAFGVLASEVEDFLRGLWALLTDDLELLVPVTLKGSSGRALPGTTGARQIDADRLQIRSHECRWRCRTCHRAQVRATPHDACLGWNCSGRLQSESPDSDDYNLRALGEGFAMVRPQEHSAQVPHAKRDEIERRFKGDGERVNTLVCTPTLELGVDIGGLDTVLMRNVPPLPANYWQRVGRAGRRHRLAVNVTYARPASHDRAYFSEPLRLLAGRVEPPSFNLRNEVMLEKHVHATVLTRLRQRARDEALSSTDREEIETLLRQVLPGRIRDYLFDEEGYVRSDPLDVSPLHTLVTKHQADLVVHVRETFQSSWPSQEVGVVSDEALESAVLGMAGRLAEVVSTLKRRLDWARRQMERLDGVRRVRGTLDADEDALHRRCDRLVKRLKGTLPRQRGQAEGRDDTSTYGVLAVEGFLPGYGLEVGSILASAQIPRQVGEEADLLLPRPPTIALREYVPGNLIYAVGHRFTPRYFHLSTEEPVRFEVDVGHDAVRELGTARDGTTSMGGATLKAVPVCDVELTHMSQILDEEEYRFQMPVAIFGMERGRHGGGRAHRWGMRDVIFRRAVHLRLVNVGPSRRVGQGELGYPLSLVNGQSRSPFASARELQVFGERVQEITSRPVEWVGFFADDVVDCLSLPGCTTRDEAYTLAEVLRLGMTQVLEMERSDLQVLVLGHPGQDDVDSFLLDPMPGGSGLLEQALDRWPEVVEAARQVARDCPSQCERSCADCLQSFRNAFYHRHLDRWLAIERLEEWGASLQSSHEIPPKLPAPAPRGEAVPVNVAEQRLRDMLERAGFEEGQWQHRIALGHPIGATIPDVFFEGPDPDVEPGVCVYLDGLSRHIHGNPETMARDQQITAQLQAKGYEVLRIPATELDDQGAMARNFFRLARFLFGRDRARDIRDDSGWFGGAG